MLGTFIFLLNLHNIGFDDEETGLKKAPRFWHSEPEASLWLISGVSSIWLMPNLFNLLSKCLHDIPILMTNCQHLRQDEKQVSNIAPKAYLSHSLPHSVNVNSTISGAETQNLSCPQLPQTPLWSLTSPTNSIFKIYPESGPFPPLYLFSLFAQSCQNVLLKRRSDQVISLFKTFQWIPLWLRVRNKDPQWLQASTWLAIDTTDHTFYPSPCCSFHSSHTSHLAMWF